MTQSINANPVNILAFQLHYADCINLLCSTSPHPHTMLVDTQADISVLRHSSIEIETPIDQSAIIQIKGITPETINTIGTSLIGIQIGKSLIHHLFHIVSDQFDINADGIIGKDFLNKFNCNINFQNMLLSITQMTHTF